METVTRVLATTSEISLKKGNRAWFERALTDNVRKAVSGLPVLDVTRPSWRVLVTFAEPVSYQDVVRRLVTVFGIGAIMPVQLAAGSLDGIEDGIGELVAGLEAESFAVRCLRSDKRFPMTSPEVERRLGTVVQQLTQWPVNLKSPKLTIHVIV
jgi:thiamine biosynthesis protein ThiI